jgi:very-short-patch-repair endonuclease
MSPSNPLFTSKNIKLRAREFRKQSTTAEAVLWEQLRNRRLAGLKFRRQHPLGPFIADFYCAEKRLVIELDGGIHVEQPGYDQLRTERLTEHGYRVLRFTNTTVETNLEKVLNIIIKICQEQNSNPTPLPELGEGQG